MVKYISLHLHPNPPSLLLRTLGVWRGKMDTFPLGRAGPGAEWESVGIQLLTIYCLGDGGWREKQRLAPLLLSLLFPSSSLSSFPPLPSLHSLHIIYPPPLFFSSPPYPINFVLLSFSLSSSSPCHLLLPFSCLSSSLPSCTLIIPFSFSLGTSDSHLSIPPL